MNKQTMLHDDIGDLVKFKEHMIANMRDLNWDGVAWVPRPDDLSKLEKYMKTINDQLTGAQLLHDRVDELVKFKENLRWRKADEWMDPVIDLDVLVVSKAEGVRVISSRYMRDFFANGTVTHWLPLSALPAVEEDPK